MKALFASAFAVMACVAFTAPSLAQAQAQSRGAVLRGLDKVTGQARDFTAPIGRPVKFGTLEVVARGCEKAPPEEPPEVKVYLEIDDKPLAPRKGVETEKRRVFAGWMFASSPAINALEHPTYDVWVIDCRT
jgi:hypothetical protein